MKTCYIYARTATTTQKASSETSCPENAKQIAQCRSYAEKHGFKVLEVFEDIGSANNPQRKGLTNLLKKCRSKSHADAVIVLNISRIARSVPVYASVRLALNHDKVQFISVYEGNLTNDRFIGFMSEAIDEWGLEGEMFS